MNKIKIDFVEIFFRILIISTIVWIITNFLFTFLSTCFLGTLDSGWTGTWVDFLLILTIHFICNTHTEYKTQKAKTKQALFTTFENKPFNFTNDTGPR